MSVTEEIAQKFEFKLADKQTESAYDVLAIPPKHLGDIWKHIIPFLILGLQANPKMTIREVADGLVDQSIQLWIAAPKDENVGIVAAFLTSIERDRGEWVLTLYGLGGKNAKAWVQACHETMMAFARREGCARVRLAGRPAWRRILPGYMVTGKLGDHLIYERAVT